MKYYRVETMNNKQTLLDEYNRHAEPRNKLDKTKLYSDTQRREFPPELSGWIQKDGSLKSSPVWFRQVALPKLTISSLTESLGANASLPDDLVKIAVPTKNKAWFVQYKDGGDEDDSDIVWADNVNEAKTRADIDAGNYIALSATRLPQLDNRQYEMTQTSLKDKPLVVEALNNLAFVYYSFSWSVNGKNYTFDNQWISKDSINEFLAEYNKTESIDYNHEITIEDIDRFVVMFGE